MKRWFADLFRCRACDARDRHIATLERHVAESQIRIVHLVDQVLTVAQRPEATSSAISIDDVPDEPKEAQSDPFTEEAPQILKRLADARDLPTESFYDA